MACCLRDVWLSFWKEGEELDIDLTSRCRASLSQTPQSLLGVGHSVMAKPPEIISANDE
jgi:hypothetical protein